MSTFTVYPKEGEPFLLHCERFEFSEQLFVLHDSSGEIPKDRAFLSVANVAAIIPEKQQEHADPVSLTNFRVRLLNRSEEILITASIFDSEHRPNILFYWQRPGSNFLAVNVLLGNVYVAASEVVSILPGGKL